MIRALILALVLVAFDAGAQSASVGLFNEANGRYRSGDFDGARRAYLQVVESGVQDARLFYNLANANFKSGRLGEAILWYERAYKLSPRDEDIVANLRFAHQVKKDRDPPANGNAVSLFLTKAFFYPTLSELSLFFAMGWMGLLGLLGWRVWGRSTQVVWLISLSICALLTVGGIGWLSFRLYHQASEVSAIALAEVVTARSGPDVDQTEVFIMHEGTKVRVVRSEGDWSLVRLQNGLGGWVRVDQIEPI